MSAKRVDFTAIIFIGVLLSALFYITATKNIGFFVVAIFFAIAFDFPHGLHTYFRIATDPEEFKLYKSEFWWSFIIIFFVSAYLIYFRDYKSLITIWVLWQLFHVYKQHIGMIALYARKASYKVSNTLPKVVLFLGCFSPILYRVYNKGFFFGDYHFFGIPLPFSGLVGGPTGVWGSWIAYSGLIPLTLVLHHFYLDGIVWRTQTNPKVGEFLVK